MTFVFKRRFYGHIILSYILWVVLWFVVLFSIILLDTVPMECLQSWTACNRGCFVLVRCFTYSLLSLFTCWCFLAIFWGYWCWWAGSMSIGCRFIQCIITNCLMFRSHLLYQEWVIPVNWWLFRGCGQCFFEFPGVLWPCWLGDRKVIRPMKNFHDLLPKVLSQNNWKTKIELVSCFTDEWHP